jgi:nicotinamidase-related amidase
MHELSLRALRSFSGVGAVDTTARSTALVIIDMQKGFVRPDGFTIRRLRDRGLDEAAAQYERQMARIVPNQQRLIAHARAHQQSVIFVNAVSYAGLQSGGQTINQWIPPASDQADILPELGRRDDDLLMSKSCSGVFTGTNIDFHLRRRQVTSLIVAGVVTDGCIEQAIRQAFDLTYACVLVSDACGALTDEIHENALERLEHRRAHVVTTDAVLTTPVFTPTDIAFARAPASS